MPKDALKRLGLKIQFSESGEAEVVEREGGVVEEEVREGRGFRFCLGERRKVEGQGASLCFSLTLALAHSSRSLFGAFARLPHHPPCGMQDVELALSGDHRARVAAFVHDLLEDDEDEAEVPVLAMRRPVVMAMAITDISAKAVKVGVVVVVVVVGGGVV